MQPGERVDMPVTFFVDPEIDNDPNAKEVTVITLSYTFFISEDEEEAEVSAKAVEKSVDVN